MEALTVAVEAAGRREGAAIRYEAAGTRGGRRCGEAIRYEAAGLRAGRGGGRP